MKWAKKRRKRKRRGRRKTRGEAEERPGVMEQRFEYGCTHELRNKGLDLGAEETEEEEEKEEEKKNE